MTGKNKKSVNNTIITEFAGTYLVSDKTTGAIARLNPEELVVFQLFDENPGDPKPLQLFFKQLGYNSSDVEHKVSAFLRKMKIGGWIRDNVLKEMREDSRLRLVYFTVTLQCNLRCPYCYQGLPLKNRTQMPLDTVKPILEKIASVNPGCQIVITGGEPLVHKDIFTILDYVQEKGFYFSILTNGTLIDRTNAERLGNYPNLTNIQVSIDGLDEKTHALSRGNSFKQTMAGIKNIIEYQLPFSLAPTIHQGNLHEIYDIAHFAITNNGFFTPNNLRTFPHSPGQGQLELDNESLYRCIKDCNDRLLANFGAQHLANLAAHLETEHLDKDTTTGARAKFICGIGHSVLDIDWDGTVYPCNLLRLESFQLGNIIHENFDTIFQRAVEKKLRVSSYDIPKCKECEFVSTCGGGCRAGAYYSTGSLAREDNLCDILYKDQIDKHNMSIATSNS